MAGIIYAVTDGTHVKVGWTSMLRTRLSQLQTGNAATLRVHATVKADCVDDECLLHNYLREKGLAIRGEWFRWCAELMALFEKHDHVDGILGELGLSRRIKLAAQSRPTKRCPSQSSRALDRLLNEQGPEADAIRGSSVHRSMLWRYRTGRSRPDASTLGLLAKLSGGRVPSNGWVPDQDVPHDNPSPPASNPGS